MWRKIQRSNKKAAKFQFDATFKVRISPSACVPTRKSKGGQCVLSPGAHLAGGGAGVQRGAAAGEGGAGLGPPAAPRHRPTPGLGARPLPLLQGPASFALHLAWSPLS